MSDLDTDQRRAVDLALAGRHLFLTGGAGVGKSFTLRAIISHLVARHGERAVAVTASTGCASVHIDGQTLHSLAGVGVPSHVSEFGKLFRSAAGQKAAAWKELRVLVIDEVSMLDAEFLDYLSIAVDRVVNYGEIMGQVKGGNALKSERDQTEQSRSAERRSKLFGGQLQLIVCGDFLQLSPVRITPEQNRDARRRAEWLPTLHDAPKCSKNGSRAHPAYHSLQTHGHFAFKSVAWQEAGFVVVELRQMHRQREAELMKALNHVRVGEGRTEAVRRLSQRTRREVRSDAAGETVQLFCTNEQCDELNASRLQPLLDDPGVEDATYVSDDFVVVDEETVREEEEAGRAREAVSAELESELWAAFFDEKDVPKEQKLAVGAQILLTANEPPGGFVNGDLGHVVAFRQPSSEELHALQEAGQPLLAGEAARHYPVVRFARKNRCGEQERLILPHNKRRRLYRVGDCIRRRLPLQLAWAITVHKSQGMSLPKLTVELSNAFAKGQCYVALSRATHLDGLCLRSFDADKACQLVSHDAKRFHAAASAASDVTTQLYGALIAGGPPAAVAAAALGKNPQPLASYYERTHFWWKDVVEGPSTHYDWRSVFRGERDDDSTGRARTTFASEFRRWDDSYPVPERLRKIKPASCQSAETH